LPTQRELSSQKKSEKIRKNQKKIRKTVTTYRDHKENSNMLRAATTKAIKQKTTPNLPPSGR
jgi:hypothetical protein